MTLNFRTSVLVKRWHSLGSLQTGIDTEIPLVGHHVGYLKCLSFWQRCPSCLVFSCGQFWYQPASVVLTRCSIGKSCDGLVISEQPYRCFLQKVNKIMVKISRFWKHINMDLYIGVPHFDTKTTFPCMRILIKNKSSYLYSINSYTGKRAYLCWNDLVFCTWYDSCALVTCAKLCCDLMASNGITLKRNYHRIC